MIGAPANLDNQRGVGFVCFGLKVHTHARSFEFDLIPEFSCMQDFIWVFELVSMILDLFVGLNVDLMNLSI